MSSTVTVSMMVAVDMMGGRISVKINVDVSVIIDVSTNVLTTVSVLDIIYIHGILTVVPGRSKGDHSVTVTVSGSNSTVLNSGVKK